MGIRALLVEFSLMLATVIVERANGFLETSFTPGREFDSPYDYNAQLAR